MHNKSQRWRLIYLLPLAILIYCKNQLRAKHPRAIFLLCLGFMVLLAIILVPLLPRFHSPTKEAVTSEITEDAPSPSAFGSIPPASTPTPAPKSVTLSFVGDCTLGTDEYFIYSYTFDAKFKQEGPDYFLQNVKDIFLEDDLTVVNFEGTITESDEREEKQYAFRGKPEFLDVLKSGSVEVTNLANNHTYDYGEQGFEDTKSTLTKAGIDHFGFDEVCIIDVNGIKVGFTGLYTVYEDTQHMEDLRANIKRLQDSGAQLIIASFHWGLKMNYYPYQDQIDLAHAAIDAGAHLVIGHHPHVLQGIEIYKGRYIAYSLGNFCFGGNSAALDYDAMIFQQTFTLYGNTVDINDDVKIIPCQFSSTTVQNDYCPIVAAGSEHTRIWNRLRELSASLGESNYFDS